METQEKALFNAAQIAEMVRALAQAILARHPGLHQVAVVGIRRGGDHLAHRLRAELTALCGVEPDTGVMDITLYRDDWTRLHARPKVGVTAIDFSLDDRVVVLVDDVLYTGRTVRAALDELIDFGRPRRVELAALIDRGWRELPIQADYVGATLGALPEEVIEVELTEGGVPEDRVVSRRRNS
jgi:pyrimidine operon attenuation protein/uracil phosphoribosyltransferase